jgi:hypothetical protein
VGRIVRDVVKILRSELPTVSWLLNVTQSNVSLSYYVGNIAIHKLLCGEYCNSQDTRVCKQTKISKFNIFYFRVF